MKAKISIFVGLSLFLVLIFLLALSGDFPLSNATNNPNAREILKANPSADIIKLDGLIYTNVSNVDWVKEKEYEIGEEIGKIKKKTSNAWWFWELYASTLPKGTKIYVPDGNGYENGDAPPTIIAEYEDELLVYHALVEG